MVVFHFYFTNYPILGQTLSTLGREHLTQYLTLWVTCFLLWLNLVTCMGQMVYSLSQVSFLGRMVVSLFEIIVFLSHIAASMGQIGTFQGQSIVTS